MIAPVVQWLRDMRDIWNEFGRLEAEAKQPVMASITYYGRLGEMGHPDDRADDWPPCDTGT